MAREIKLVWNGAKRQIYSVKTITRIESKRVSRTEHIGTTIKGWKWRKISPRFAEQLERLLQGRLKSFPGTWLHSLIGKDVKALATSVRNAIASKGLQLSTYARRVANTLSEEEWAKLRAKASYIAQSVKESDGMRRQQKGLVHEVFGIRQIFGRSSMTEDGKKIMDELRDIVKNAPDADKWHHEIYAFERAYARSASGGGEVGDLIFVAFRDPKNPSKGMWVVGIGNQKSASNALHLVSHRSVVNLDPKSLEEGIPKYGEFLGQGGMDVERVSQLGIEIPGIGKFNLNPAKGEGRLKIRPKDCLRIGVVPIDTKIGALNRLENLAKQESNFRLLISPMSDKDADTIVSAINSAVQEGQ
jgi:hypothetical protein